MVIVALAAVLALSGCSRAIDGTAVAGDTTSDADRLFDRPAPTYGFDLSRNESNMLAYLQALRGIDPCGFADRDVFAGIGEIVSVGTLVAFDECGVDVEVSGQRDSEFISIGVGFGYLDEPIAFRAGGLPVHEVYPGACYYEMPLDLSMVPAAPPQPNWTQPVVRVDSLDSDCGFARSVVEAVAPRVAALELTLRDGASAYPVALAERDPCEVLSVLPVEFWDVEYSSPYECSFTTNTDGYDESIWLTLRPQLFEEGLDAPTRRDRGGVEVLYDEYYCAADAFVGPQLQPKLTGGNTGSTGDVVIRPAVSVEGDLLDCETAIDLAVAAAELYG